MSALRWRRPASPRRSDPHPQASLVALMGTVLAFESSLYSAVTPVLPHYAHELHASKPALGVLSAAYAVGLIPGSLLGGWVASRAGVRRTTFAGLTIFALAVPAFGFATSLIVLDGLRVIQGVCSGLIWGGALTWVIAASGSERRGATIGASMAAATFGTLLGPLFGTAAAGLGTVPVFCTLGAVSLALALIVRTRPEPQLVSDPEGPGLRRVLRRVLSTGAVPLGAWLIGLEAMAIGTTNVLIPLRLSHFGASGVAIGATFLAASALSSLLSPVVGAVTDRRGTRLPLLVGLSAATILLAALLLPRSSLGLALLSVVALGAPLTAYMIPAVSMMTSSAEAAGVALLVVTTVGNVAFAGGETIGAPLAGVLSQATSDAVPILLLAALMLITLWPVSRLPRRSPGQLVDPPEDQPSTASSVTSRATSAA